MLFRSQGQGATTLARSVHASKIPVTNVGSIDRESCSLVSPPLLPERLRAALPWLAVAVVSFLPFMRGILAGQAFYFRDISRQFYPMRRFALDGLLHGELRFWNPMLHEGEPVSLPPLSYPADLLQLVRPDEAGMSATLALHVPLGALAFMALARSLGVPVLAAAGGAFVYSLGGFFLSTLNFYVYLQAAAWAPLLILTLRRAAEHRSAVAACAATTAVALSTTGAELVGQAILLGVVLSLERACLFRRLLRMAAALFIGIGLSAPTLATLHAAVAGSAREEGFPTDVVLAQSLHPLTFVQALIGNWHGDLGNLANRWWGSNFFPLGFPYFLSLYVGAAALALAVVGLLQPWPFRARIAALGVFGFTASLGSWAGLRLFVDAAPFLRTFRHPSKAFFTVHLCLAVFAAVGLRRLTDPRARDGWRHLALVSLPLGGALTLAPALPSLVPKAVAWFLAGFLPPSYDWPNRVATANEILYDASAGGLVAVAVGLLAWARLQGGISTARASAGVVGLLAADLLRTGAGLNPMVGPSFYRLSSEMEGVSKMLRRNGGRTFVCDPESGSEYFRARSLRIEHDVFTFATFMETLTPAYNMNAGVATALSRDLTMLVPVERVLAPEESGAVTIPAVLDRLREAGVSSVLCLEPLRDPRLREVTSVAPARIAPARIHVYELTSSLPLVSLVAAGRPDGEPPVGRIVSSEAAPGSLRVNVEVDEPVRLLVREARAPGWSARLDEQPTHLEPDELRHLAVAIPPGPHAVRLTYRPPGLAGACAMGLVSLGILLTLWLRGRRGGANA